LQLVLTQHFNNNREQEEVTKKQKVTDLLLNVVNTLISENSEDSSPFMTPVTEQIAPGYTSIIKQKKDFATIKKYIRNKKITSVLHLHRSLLSLFQNAQLFNPRQYAIHDQAKLLRSKTRELIHKALKEESEIMGTPLPAIYHSSEIFPHIADKI
jgi:bromodomain-containing protein 8